MTAEGKNFEAITKAKADHNAKCPFPPHTVRMNPFEIERMQWDEGDVIAGLVLEGDAKVGTGAFRLVCDGMEPPELEIEEVEAIGAPTEPLEVPVGPGRPGPAGISSGSTGALIASTSSISSSGGSMPSHTRRKAPVPTLGSPSSTRPAIVSPSSHCMRSISNGFMRTVCGGKGHLAL